MTSPDTPIAAAPSKEKVFDLTLRHGKSLLDLELGDGIADIQFKFFIHPEPPPERLAEVMNLLHCWEAPLWEPTKHFVLAFLGLDSLECPMSRLRTEASMSNVWLCGFSRKLLISQKVLDRWDTCSIQLQFDSLQSDHFSIFVRPWYASGALVSDASSVHAELALIDKAFNLASHELGQLIGAVLLKLDTKIALGKTVPPSNLDDPDDGYVIRGVVVN